MKRGQGSCPEGLPDSVGRLVRRGWRVIPQAQDKSSCVRWRQYMTTTPTRSELNRWAVDFPDCMWAVITGQASGVIVFDFDVRDGGMETLERLGAQPAILTPSGGAHVYAWAPEFEVRGGARLDPENLSGMDLRADGQLATVYGTNRLSGGSYQRVTRGPVHHVEDLPVELRRLVVARQKAAHRPTVTLPEGFSDFAPTNVLVMEAKEMVESGGSRNAAGFHLACQLRDDRHAIEDAETVMREFAELADGGSHPYTFQEAYNSLVSAYSSAPREPRSMAKHRFGDGYAYTDYGNAERLIARHGDDLRWAPFRHSWLTWDGRRWSTDESGEVERRCKSTARDILRAAAEVDDPLARDSLIKWARNSESATRLRNMEVLARTEPGQHVTPEDLDADHWVLNVANGTLNLRNGELHRADPNELITKLAPVSYDPAARAPRWTKFLEDVLQDPEVRSFVQRAVGYSLTGTTEEHVAMLLYGQGANGKSTFLETLRAVLGDYAQQAPSDLLLAKRNNSVPNDLARIRGARFVSTVETDDGRQIAEAFFKQVTGGDRLSARFLYGEWFEFDPSAKFWLATNHKPEVRSNGEAIWRRILLVPFTVTIPPDRRNRRLGVELRRELPGILRWAVEGALAWQREGLRVPDAVLSATAEYRDEMDILGDFIEERCSVGTEFRETSSALYAAYTLWAEMEGHCPAAQQKFGRMLTERGFSKTKVDGGRRAWTGISLRHSDSPAIPVVR